MEGFLGFITEPEINVVRIPVNAVHKKRGIFHYDAFGFATHCYEVTFIIATNAFRKEFSSGFVGDFTAIGDPGPIFGQSNDLVIHEKGSLRRVHSGRVGLRWGTRQVQLDPELMS